MSVKIGQFRRNQKNVDNFFQEKIFNYEIGTASFVGADGETKHKELAIFKPEGQNYFLEGKTYYIQGNAIQGGPKCTVKLVNSSDSSNLQQQIIGRISGKLDFTFTPNRPDYQYLVFAFENNNNPGSFNGKPNLYKLGNVCGDSGTKVPSKVKKIGIQGMPGLRFFINGENFIMGKSGIFMLGDMDITQISFLVRNFSDGSINVAKTKENYINYFPYITDGKEFFIMDYEY